MEALPRETTVDVLEKRLREDRGSAQVFRWWTLAHGYVMLEGSGYLDRAKGVERVLAPLLIDFLVGEGCPRPRAEASIGRSLA